MKKRTNAKKKPDLSYTMVIDVQITIRDDADPLKVAKTVERELTRLAKNRRPSRFAR